MDNISTTSKTGETIIALDLEGTLISNAVSQFARFGLFDFLTFCSDQFEKIYIYTAVRDAIAIRVVQTLVSHGHAPSWLEDIPLVQWDRNFKDLNNIPDSQPSDCLLVDDNRDYIIDDQVSQWIPINKFESPYPDTDLELLRIQKLISERLTAGVERN